MSANGLEMCFKIMNRLLYLLMLTGLYACTGTYIHQDETCLQVMELAGRDQEYVNPVYFCSRTDGELFYYSSLKTTVCNDTLCQLVLLKMYWDPAGNYTSFDTLPGMPLTKNDHIPFTSQDYEKLHTALKDHNSVLGRKAEDELLDQYRTRYSGKIDAVTAATAMELRTTVVEGALYSTYTLWHLANGDIRRKIQDHTLANYNPAIEKQLLGSSNPMAVLLGLKYLDENDYMDRFDQIIDIMKYGSPLVNFYIAKKIPQEVFDIRSNRKSIEKIWHLLDQNTRSVLIKYIDQK
jgi:hypothetical protein